MKRIIVLAAISVLGVSSMASAFPFFGGNNLVVVRVGNGGALGSTATATFLEEYAISGGAIVQPAIALPTTDSGGNQTLTLSGTATSEGFLKRSTNGQYLTMIGYDAATGTGSITSSTATSINRVVARINSSALIDTTTALADASSTSNPRSAISTNGTDLWVSGGAGGSRYTTLGSTTSTQLSTSPTNLRVLNIFNTQLYTTSGSSPFIGVSTIDGPGPATTSGQTTTLLPGFTGSSGPSPYDFYFASSSLLYVCDDRSAASGGGLQRWDLNAGTWSNTYTLALGTTTAGGCRGLYWYVQRHNRDALRHDNRILGQQVGINYGHRCRLHVHDLGDSRRQYGVSRHRVYSNRARADHAVAACVWRLGAYSTAQIKQCPCCKSKICETTGPRVPF